jgi:prepilin signal peptidase PulO-like enzyme (type II secretory pathway)
MEQFFHLSLLVIVAVMGWVQIPLDLRNHELSRRVTGVGLLGVTAVGIVAGVSAGSFQNLWTAVLVSALLVTVYYLLHRLSRRSLGFGDVLLVIPLSLAVSLVQPELTLAWQLAASTSGAVHAVIMRIRSRVVTVPFGPHLICSAWLVIVTNL